MSEPMILIEGLERSFGATKAIDKLSLRVERGQIYGLVGPDGAGKTCTMRILCGAILPDSGRAEVAGFDVVRQLEEVRRVLGYMPQRFSLYPDLTVGENLHFFADLFQVPRKQQKQRIEELLERSHLLPFIGRQAGRLSGGMKQKLALACALLHRPQLVLLDEPTTGVDPVSRREFWEIVRASVREGMTVLLSTPAMDEAERCHRVAFVAEGRILAEGRPKELQALVPGSMIELWVEPQRKALQFLRGQPFVHEAQMFGELLHVALDQLDGRDASDYLRSILAAAGFEIRQIRRVSPSMEDVFMALSRRSPKEVA